MSTPEFLRRTRASLSNFRARLLVGLVLVCAAILLLRRGVDAGRAVAASLGLSDDGSGTACTANPLVAGWLPSDFARAVSERVVYAARSPGILKGLDGLALSHGRTWFELLAPTMLTCGGGGLVRYGVSGDGGKQLCNVRGLPPKCVILSLGSAGQWDFEEAMSSATPCEVYTFDCTISAPKSLPPRVHFEATCLGEDTAGDGRYQTLPTIVARLGLSRVHLLKMDIGEGAG